MKDKINPSKFYATTASTLNIEAREVKQATEQEIKEEVSLALKRYRIKKRITNLDVLAKEIGVSRMQLYRWEEMKSKPSPIAIKVLKDMGIL